MTRINLVPPSELHTKHLVAEYREAPRIFGLVRAAQERGELPDDRRNPTEYRLGTGHCRFFYPRLVFLRDRLMALVSEMQTRGYSPLFTDPHDLSEFEPHWLGTYEPTPEALRLSRERIQERSTWSDAA